MIGTSWPMPLDKVDDQNDPKSQISFTLATAGVAIACPSLQGPPGSLPTVETLPVYPRRSGRLSLWTRPGWTSTALSRYPRGPFQVLNPAGNQRQTRQGVNRPSSRDGLEAAIFIKERYPYRR